MIIYLNFYLNESSLAKPRVTIYLVHEHICDVIWEYYTVWNFQT